MGTSPQTPGISRFAVGSAGEAGKPARRSNTARGARVPFLERPILRRGLASITLTPGFPANSMSVFHCRKSPRHGINQMTLTAN